ncbi:MAG TPA: asparaginase domain-containing protein [Usitatibacter sp.]|jgi:L-asparaginase|nr:asparaginase domain-containing protein [Usitatibacter sp.]
MPAGTRDAARIIVTGGTFDKRYDAIKGELTFSETHLPALLGEARVTLPLAVDIRLLIDSLQMTDAHRQSVLSACRESNERSIVVVHGTDTMVDTAQVVGRAALDKTVVFTGAMVPYSVQGSDAPFNLGFALAAALTLPAGAYVAMNAKIFTWDDVMKDKAEGNFKPRIA